MNPYSRSGARIPIRVKRRTKLVFLLLLVLAMSSGSVIYVDTPIFYYGILGVSILLIIIVVLTLYHITHEAPGLFAEDNEVASDDLDSKQSTGLERVLEAEQKYKKRGSRSTKTHRTSYKKKKSKEEPEEKKVKKEKIELKSFRDRDERIGSVPMEDSYFKEKYHIKKKSDEKTIVKSKKKVTTFLCPTCGSKELYYEAGLISGYKYHCKDCDYIGSFVIEKDFKI